MKHSKMGDLIITEQRSGAFRPRRKASLVDAVGDDIRPGVIEWGGTAALTGITDREAELVKQKLGVKKVDYARTMQVKSLMRSKKCGEIVLHFRGKKGYKESTIRHTHAALSQAEAERAALCGAK